MIFFETVATVSRCLNEDEVTNNISAFLKIVGVKI